MQLWQYHPETKEFVGTTTADPDPLSPGDFIIPAFATQAQPPMITEGHQAVFVGNAWSLVEDHRGETWWAGYGQPVTITALGPPAEGLTATEPDAPVVEPPPPVIPNLISRRQFFQQAAISGHISEADALAAIAAVIPPNMSEIIDAMPAEQQFAVRMLVSGAVDFDRRHPVSVAFGTAFGMSSEDIDAFWLAASVL